MSNNKYKGELFTFWQLLKKQNIEIPIIQRDYAQGREDKEELRGNFLNALHDSLKELKPIKLDFIYGSEEGNSFQPLDGQQRLTTLFLLHWYAALMNSKLDQVTIDILRKFSYETRTSSREFCRSLVSNKIVIQNSDIISTIIKDSSWFFLSWKKDPTIDAMLRTIDDIHKRFGELDNLWDKLASDQNLISFYHVELSNIGLTDDLYIKMNARGKLLTSFENFKASFQKHIIDNNWQVNKNSNESFACKIDTIWTDLFWNHRKENSIDESMIRFISTIAMIQQGLEKKEDRISEITKIQRNPNAIKVEYFSNSGFNYLCECFDIYCKVFKEKIKLDLNFPLWQHKPEGSIFSALVYEDNTSSAQRNSASYTLKVLFYAQTEYLRKVPAFNEEYFQCWMRVIRNIVSRGDITKNGERPAIIRSPEAFDRAIILINELSEGCEDIYTFLAKGEPMKSAFTKEQIEEERLKAELIMADDDNRRVIFKMEDTNLLQGRIDFAFYCLDYNKNIENFDKFLFDKIQKVITKYLSNENNMTNDLRRALLTISDDKGEYKYYEYWWSFSFVVDANKRCLIDKFRELEYYIYGNYKNRDYYRIYLKKLIFQLMGNDLNGIISAFTTPNEWPNWKTRLINEPALLNEKCKSNYIAIPKDESRCYLLKSVRPRDINACEEII